MALNLTIPPREGSGVLVVVLSSLSESGLRSLGIQLENSCKDNDQGTDPFL